MQNWTLNDVLLVSFMLSFFNKNYHSIYSDIHTLISKWESKI